MTRQRLKVWLASSLIRMQAMKDLAEVVTRSDILFPGLPFSRRLKFSGSRREWFPSSPPSQ